MFDDCVHIVWEGTYKQWCGGNPIVGGTTKEIVERVMGLVGYCKTKPYSTFPERKWVRYENGDHLSKAWKAWEIYDVSEDRMVRCGMDSVPGLYFTY